ncbi:hypothetical protein A2774_02955 [Candidatus Roizmanbacteria bacterium RIFCSPHIGHO2_01_FULL_39_12c]|uniref:PDZ domain-containing protein n=1 Tax=Candidatus Roizmanbacteria bacterium RIFCSPHIGHO2_01_FULL_39_12c TaxID=1802031 RepID=A0A1F7GBT3_9BACT|nr:MAG: hypothetical protein A2774_02955 [Candidatus Roizmanbacteria bacterium RIFCSPHIGHO2_01_FULL_39_12c]OGK47442.1 MAG: hypothetical protein A2963_04785 [Candidatus Roizmanbacteria bacterium RIFCSPLOWO2_01_FULL_40_13]
MKKLLLIIAGLIIFLTISQRSRLPINLPQLPTSTENSEKQVVVYEESVITKVVEESLPSVVTIGISKTTSTGDFFEIDPFNPFSPFRRIPGRERNVEQNIGSGFFISPDGLIITNKHVVQDSDADYRVLTNDNQEFEVAKIYRDPLNDLAILKINTSGLKPLKLGNSSKLKLGQLTIAIGTPLGEFQNTITSGIVSGLGRGITAGSPFEEYVEKLDNVIQTDAAINPGNSGGPLLNSNGEVIGVNTAIASEVQNIGFAIPVNVVKDLMVNFNRTGGSFERPYIGVRYKIIDRQTAVLNDLVEGAYVIEVLEDSPAQQAEIQEEDVIIEFDGQKVNGDDDQSLAKKILEKKIGQRVDLKIWRNGETFSKTLILETYEE